jgi:hypothetical protein
VRDHSGQKLPMLLVLGSLSYKLTDLRNDFTRMGKPFLYLLEQLVPFGFCNGVSFAIEHRYAFLRLLGLHAGEDVASGWPEPAGK